MKPLYVVLSVLVIFLCSSFKANDACEYAGSNIGFIKTQTQLALENDDLSKSKFLTYKAIRAIYKLKSRLKECGCDQAVIYIEESEYALKKVTKTHESQEAKTLLNKAHHKIVASIEAIEKHHLHENKAALDKNIDLADMPLDVETLHVMIDDSLLPFEKSLQEIVNSVNCKDARKYAQRIFDICEQELLKPNLSEGKKHYNLRTQEITAAALKKIGDCKATISK